MTPSIATFSFLYGVMGLESGESAHMLTVICAAAFPACLLQPTRGALRRSALQRGSTGLSLVDILRHRALD
jgi:hypothetical protein